MLCLCGGGGVTGAAADVWVRLLFFFYNILMSNCLLERKRGDRKKKESEKDTSKNTGACPIHSRRRSGTFQVLLPFEKNNMANHHYVTWWFIAWRLQQTNLSPSSSGQDFYYFSPFVFIHIVVIVLFGRSKSLIENKCRATNWRVSFDVRHLRNFVQLSPSFIYCYCSHQDTVIWIKAEEWRKKKNQVMTRENWNLSRHLLFMSQFFPLGSNWTSSFRDVELMW